MPNILTYGGEARSGKGTCVRAVMQELVSRGQEVVAIDQGLKFRALGELGLSKRIALDDEAEVRSYLRSDTTRRDMLQLLARVKEMNQAEIDDLLYKSAVAAASGQIGRVPESHGIAVSLLRDEVKQASADNADVVLIDGRVMEKYARQFTKEGLGKFLFGWHFRCDSSVAARRSLGMFVDYATMTQEQKLHLSAETIKISERNRSDAMREVDPMVEPEGAYVLDLSCPNLVDPTVHQRIADQNRDNIINLTTSYTRSIEQMTVPVVGISVAAITSA